MSKNTRRSRQTHVVREQRPRIRATCAGLYQNALNGACASGDRGQIYYLAINVAFLEFAAFDRVERAREMAQLAIRNAALSNASAWSVATQAEANLYLGNHDRALNLYSCMLKLDAEPWMLASAALQAGQIVSKLGDGQVAERLEGIFAPTLG